LILKLVGKFDTIDDDDLFNDERNVEIHGYVKIENEGYVLMENGECETHQN